MIENHHPPRSKLRSNFTQPHQNVICTASMLSLCFFFFFSLPSSSNAQFLHSKDRLSFQILNQRAQNEDGTDTDNDPFNLLSEEELQKEWSIEATRDDTLLLKIQKLKHSFEELINVEIQLVGFDGQTNKLQLDKVFFGGI